jgi:hypothetical protein
MGFDVDFRFILINGIILEKIGYFEHMFEGEH